MFNTKAQITMALLLKVRQGMEFNLQASSQKESGMSAVQIERIGRSLVGDYIRSSQTPQTKPN